MTSWPGDPFRLSAHPTPMRSRFTAEQLLRYPCEVVFAFFSNPANLPPLMPLWQHTRIEQLTLVPPPPRPTGTPTLGPAAGNGTRLLLSARPFPFSPLRGHWDALIEDFHWNDHFCDRQLHGPFRYWRHCHSVHTPPGGGSGTLVRDEIDFDAPLTALSTPFVQAILASAFRFRQQRTAEFLPAFAAKA